MVNSEKYCQIPKDCEVHGIFANNHNNMFKAISCYMKNGSKLEFENDFNSTNCVSLQYKSIDLYFKKPNRKSSILVKNSINMSNLIEFTSEKEIAFRYVLFDSFKGFDINIYEYENLSFYFPTIFMVECFQCNFEFYKSGKKIESCEEMSKETEITSIFQLISHLNSLKVKFVLDNGNKRICPLAFKNVFLFELSIEGYNSYILKKTLSFTSDTFSDLNSVIMSLKIDVVNIDIDLNLINPSVFANLTSIMIFNDVNSIHPDMFVEFKAINRIEIMSNTFKSLIHNGGIEWVKNINKGLDVNLTDLHQNLDSLKIIIINSNVIYRSSLSQTFPDEDFCIYKDFPFNQMVYIKALPISEDVTCTFLYLIQYYKYYMDVFALEPDYLNQYENAKFFADLKSNSSCNFEQRLNKCDISEFKIKPITSNEKLQISMESAKIIIHISTYPISIVGIVTNILIIITISSGINKAEFNGFNQYKYLRINSVLNCLILFIHITKSLNMCEFPYQLFCSQIRKVVFFQYFNGIFHDVVFTALQFMSNFIYMAFAFNRISLIGKDHNKLVKFMSDLGIKKYIVATFIISVCFSAIKFFSYRVNYGQPYYSYPIDYNSQTVYFTDNINLAYFILNSISDLFNYCVFLFVHLIIDVGMVVKLRQTLNEKLDKAKLFYSKEVQEKRQEENASVVNNAIFMVILNTFVSVLLKFPTCIYSIITLVYQVNRRSGANLNSFGKFYFLYCVEATFCQTYIQISGFLYLLSISIVLFFYKHFDKKIKVSFERKFSKKKDNTKKKNNSSSF